ncbi:MAG: hypothetical protein GEU97_21745 [Actinophytocola sp.]|nr:hypothetical protein [Actinophytocola sp.]
MVVLVVVAVFLSIMLAPVAQGVPDPPPSDPCTASAGDPEPGTIEWQARDQQNMWCANQRQRDLMANRAHQQAYVEELANWPEPTQLVPKPANRPGFDPFRVPWSRWDGIRGRYLPGWFTLPDGARLHFELFAPLGPCPSRCSPTPEGVRRLRPPYPGVTWMVGGLGQKQQQWMLAQHLAESGYMVLLFDPPGAGNSELSAAGGEDDEDLLAYRFALRQALDFFFSTPDAPTPQGDVNPWNVLLDRRYVGVAGWSLGAISANRVGQLDPRISTVVGWDSCENIVPEWNWAGLLTGCESRPPAGIDSLGVPSLQLSADGYGLSGVPYPRVVPPDPHRLDGLHQKQRAQGVESMQVSLRAATHLDFGPYYVSGTCFCSRYGEMVSLYYTEAWFDYQLKGVTDPKVRKEAFRRLTATVFDDSADEHSIGTGTYDPEVGNVPYRIAELPVADRLSFYFRSGYYLIPDGRTVHSCTDMRAGCAPTS